MILPALSPAMPTEVPALLPLLGDKDPLVRAHTARALGVVKSAQADDQLIKLMADKDERVAASAITALGVIGDARAVDALVSLATLR